jgi:uncharacterized cupin superfamily protein
MAFTGKTLHLFNARSGALAERDGLAKQPDGLFGESRHTNWVGANGVSAGSARWSGRARISAFPHTETMVLVAGGLRLEVDGKKFNFGPGDGLVISRATDVTMEATEGTQWVFCATRSETSKGAGAFPIDRDAPLSPSAPPPAQFVKGEMPDCQNIKVFEDVETRFRVGVWGTTPHVRLSRPHPVDEFMYIFEGEAEVTDADGSTLSISAGDAIFVARGVVNQLALRTPLKKIFVIAES